VPPPLSFSLISSMDRLCSNLSRFFRVHPRCLRSAPHDFAIRDISKSFLTTPDDRPRRVRCRRLHRVFFPACAFRSLPCGRLWVMYLSCLQPRQFHPSFRFSTRSSLFQVSTALFPFVFRLPSRRSNPQTPTLTLLDEDLDFMFGLTYPSSSRQTTSSGRDRSQVTLRKVI